jgi:hypothetical protein
MHAQLAAAPTANVQSLYKHMTRAHQNRSYEAYLDSQITSTDMFYLEDIHRARYLVELG